MRFDNFPGSMGHSDVTCGAVASKLLSMDFEPKGLFAYFMVHFTPLELKSIVLVATSDDELPAIDVESVGLDVIGIISLVIKHRGLHALLLV